MIELIKVLLAASLAEEEALWYADEEVLEKAHQALQDTLKRALYNLTEEN